MEAQWNGYASFRFCGDYGFSAGRTLEQGVRKKMLQAQLQMADAVDNEAIQKEYGRKKVRLASASSLRERTLAL